MKMNSVLKKWLLIFAGFGIVNIVVISFIGLVMAISRLFDKFAHPYNEIFRAGFLIISVSALLATIVIVVYEKLKD